MLTTATISELRDLVPLRPLSNLEAVKLAELQATKLLRLGDISEAPVPDELISELPGVDVRYATVPNAPTSGLMRRRDDGYLIIIDATERPYGRRRFSLAHELKHVLDYPFVATLYPPGRWLSSRQRQELICDAFAAALLMPRLLVKRAWVSGVQDVTKLARRFEVSTAAMQTRLMNLGLLLPRPRCGYESLATPSTSPTAHPSAIKEPA